MTLIFIDSEPHGLQASSSVPVVTIPDVSRGLALPQMSWCV